MKTLTAREFDASPTDHLVRFYDNDTSLCDTVGRFLLDGYGEGASSIVIATAEHRIAIERVLAAGGVNVAEAKRSDRLTFADAEETMLSFTIGGIERGVLDRDAFRESVGGMLEKASAASPSSSVRAYGEMVDVFLRRGNEAAMFHLEESWNEMRRTRPFQLYCGYRLSHLDRAEDQEPFRRICGLHSHVLPSESYDEESGVEEKRRQIVDLQQRARSLETEVVERKRLGAALQEEQKQLREANRRKDEFLAILGHELRNPLNPILTALDLMDMRGDDNSRRERDIIRRQALHLAGLVEDLLDISRVTGGKLALRKEPLEVAIVIARAIEMASPLLEQRAHLLQIAVPPRGLLVYADPIRIPQVFANLLMNAAKYTERGGRIELKANRDGEDVVVECKDNGIGVAPELLATMFEPFVQGTRSLDRAEGGMGLGLALVKSLTQLHGGVVSARSAGPGLGTTFTVRLPALEEARGTLPPPRTQESNGHNGAAASVERVLVVDDNMDCALGFAEVIRHLGHEVEVAFDGPRAIQKAATFKPTVALVDIGLPVMDGYELARRLREVVGSDPLKLVAVTGYGEDANRALSQEAGFDLHAVKPVDLGSLRALIGNGQRSNGSH